MNRADNKRKSGEDLVDNAEKKLRMSVAQSKTCITVLQELCAKKVKYFLQLSSDFITYLRFL
jgi:hypothetical protein